MNYTGVDVTWYKKQPLRLGKHSISSLLKDAASEAGLSGKRITNHSGRKTGVKRLLDDNVSPQYIAQLTGHKSVTSLASYAEAGITVQRKMSKTIATVSSTKTSVEFRQLSQGCPAQPRRDNPVFSSSANSTTHSAPLPVWSYFQGTFENWGVP